MTLPEVARLVHRSRSRIWQLVQAGRLPAQQVGRAWLVRRNDAEAFASSQRPRGRPRKKKGGTGRNDRIG
jgi:excisionase family DNA binding protein